MVWNDVLWWAPLLRRVRRLQYRRQLGEIYSVQGLVKPPLLIWVSGSNLDPR